MKKLIKNFIIIICFSCQPKANPPLSSSSGQIDQDQSLTGPDQADQTDQKTKKIKKNKKEQTSEQIKKTKKISSQTLYISQIRVGTYQDKVNLNELLMYEVSGSADYIEYNICPASGGDCISNVYTLDRLILPIIKAGQISIKIKACVDKSRSLDDDNCGQWNELIHDTHRYDDDLARLLAEKDRIVSRLGQIETDYRQSLKTYQTEAAECLKRDSAAQKFLDKKLKFIDLILSAPPGMIADSLSMQANKTAGFLGLDGETNPISKAGSEFTTRLSNFMNEQCEKLGESMCGTAHMIASMGGMMAAAFNPINSIGILSNAFHDLSASDDELVKKTCHADDNFQLRQKTMDQLWIQSRDRLKQIKADIDSKG